MKAKEYPCSLYRSWQLRRPDAATLRAAPRDPLPLLVSLTSIPSRLKTIHLTLRSLMTQTRSPQKIVLWLHRDLEDKLPARAAELCGELLEVRHVELTCSHRKLVHALQAFPDKVVVTCDDDLMYPPDWLELLYASHLRAPADIIGNACRRIRRDGAGELLPYRQWTHERGAGVSADDLLAVGSSGVLYPPGCLPAETSDPARFLQLAPNADDLWFKAMALRQGTTVRTAFLRSATPWPIAGSQAIALKKGNVREDRNRAQWDVLSRAYGLQRIGRAAT